MAVLDAPVRTDCLRQAGGIRRQAAQVEASLDAGLAVNGHHGIPAHSRENRAYPTPERRFEFHRIDQAEQPAEGVMGGNAVIKPQVAAQPVELLLCPPLDLDESVGANQHSIDRHHQQFNQVVFDLDCRIRKDHAPHNFTALRKFALALLRQDSQYPKRSLRSRRKTADRLPDYRASLLGLAPLR